MAERVHPLVEQWYADKAVVPETFLQIEAAFRVELPLSYKQFLISYGSGEAIVRDGSVVLYAPGELMAMHAESGSGFPAANLLLFGGNGSGEAFAFNLRTRPCRFVMVPLIGSYETDRVDLGERIDDLFDYPRWFGAGIA